MTVRVVHLLINNGAPNKSKIVQWLPVIVTVQKSDLHVCRSHAKVNELIDRAGHIIFSNNY